MAVRDPKSLRQTKEWILNVMGEYVWWMSQLMHVHVQEDQTQPGLQYGMRLCHSYLLYSLRMKKGTVTYPKDRSVSFNWRTSKVIKHRASWTGSVTHWRVEPIRQCWGGVLLPSCWRQSEPGQRSDWREEPHKLTEGLNSWMGKAGIDNF